MVRARCGHRVLTLALSLAAGSPAPPNIVLLMADDMGWGDLASYGHPTQEVGHIDKLAAGGLRFRQWYAAESVCTPSRAAALTGRLPARIGMIPPPGAGDRVLVVQQELLPGAGWIFATRGDDCGYVPRNYITEEVASVSEAVLVKEQVLTIESDAHLTLGPLDWQNRGRAIPCTWFFPAVLPPQKLVDALRDTLNGLPHFAARCTRDGSGLEPGGAVSVEVRRSPTPFAEAYVQTTRKTTFKRTAHEAYVPSKAGMDPDEGLATTPLLKIRITLFEDGTAIGVLVQHAITDIESLVAFMRAWSRCVRGGNVSPRQDRWAPAAVDEVLGAPRPRRVRTRIDIQGDRITLFPVCGAGFETGAVGHHDFDEVIIRMDVFFHFPPLRLGLEARKAASSGPPHTRMR